ncbi:hypothetical protein BaRGS_00035909 [Batillaria attramentaria]|uniref:m7GpppX diphosphatase n=1 Tax=Batillaria attramentaria TaxID=370345 RepID=A0ABD0JD52_9CAEN
MAASVIGDLAQESPAKKQKLSDEGVPGDAKQEANAFQNLEIVKVLREDSKLKLITVLGRFTGVAGKEAVVLLERLPFHKEKVADVLSSEDGRTEETLKNDIYSTHNVFSSRTLADCKATVIYPATSKHIDKYTEHVPFIVRETPELFRKVTKPCLESSKFSLQWVLNILEKKTESDRIVFEDPDPETGFILLPDMKWNRSDLESLYLVAIVHKHGIHSIRDLRREHLPLLKNILVKGKAAIKEKFNIPGSKLRIYFHYQPSYGHLHVHFTHVKFDAPGSDCLRAHLLEDVMENLEMDDQFYSKKTLIYVVRENEDLYKAYKAAGYFDE